MKLLRYIIPILAFFIGYQLAYEALPIISDFFQLVVDPSMVQWINIIGGLILALITFLMIPWIARRMVYFVDSVDMRFQRTPVQDIIVSIGGLISGLILANLLTVPLNNIPIIGQYLPVIANVLIGSFGLMIAWNKRNELTALFSQSN